MNPRVIVHHPKYKVDGITKYLETQAFEFDHVRLIDAFSPMLGNFLHWIFLRRHLTKTQQMRKFIITLSFR